jgi:hypothetical protein
MNILIARPLLPCLLLATGWCHAEAPAPGLPALAASQAAAPASRVPDAQLLHEVTEDDHVRIDELRTRGQTQRIVVQPKIPGMPAYEIVPQQAGRSAVQDARAGQRVWLNLNF